MPRPYRIVRLQYNANKRNFHFGVNYTSNRLRWSRFSHPLGAIEHPGAHLRQQVRPPVRGKSP